MKVVQYSTRDYMYRPWDRAPNYNMFAMIKDNTVYRSYTNDEFSDDGWSGQGRDWLNTFSLELIY
jgi:hypothetical protein